MPLTALKRLDLYRMMVRIRVFEDSAVQLYKRGELRGSLHPCTGQEASAVGGVAALQREDYLICTYRGHGQSLAKGLDVGEAMAELLGRRTGCAKGKGGSMHFVDPQVGLLGENAIVGAGVPLAVGAATSAQIEGCQRVAMTFFGDGAVNQGLFAEALNLAVIWCLPLILVCENNQYSEMTPIRTMVGTNTLSERARGFGVKAVEVDGNDVEAVFMVANEAVARARAGEGPTFIEAHTYRLLGHMIGDSEVYRSKAEVAIWREQRDPIKQLRIRLLEHGVTDSDLAMIEAEVADEIAMAVQFARESPVPEASEIWDDIWVA